MDSVKTLFANIQAAISDVDRLLGPQTWSGAAADAWTQSDWGGAKGILKSIMNNAAAEEPSLVADAKQKPALSPHLRGPM